MKENNNIHVSEFYKLISFTSNGQISIKDLDKWLQHQTEKKFTVIEKDLLDEIRKIIKDYSIAVKDLNNKFEKKLDCY